MDEQPTELAEFLAEAEALVMDWYGRGGVEASHEINIEHMATLFALDVVMRQAETFAAMTEAARVYLTAAFQMGRACGNDSRVVE